MKKEWQYLTNQFENSTRGSYKKAVKLSTYHEADLKTKADTEPLLIPIYERYLPKHLELIKEYNNWKSAGGSQEGQTLNLEQMLTNAYGNVPLWDINIQAKGANFMKGTPNYLSIFMNGRKPFIQGSIDERINAYDTLSKNLAAFPPLDGIRTEVDVVYTKLDDARKAQLGAKGNLKSGSGIVETVRKAAMTMQYRNLGFAMDAFWDKPMYIESMFDLQTLRESSQSIFTGTLDPSENEAVLIHTFLSDDQLRLKNNGNADILFYLATTTNGTDSDFIKITANTQETITMSQFGAIDFNTHRYLTAVNTSATVATHYEVEVL